MAATFYKAVGGITHGMTHYKPGVVFRGDAVLDAAFEDSEGKVGDVVQYEKASKADYDRYLAEQKHDLVDGSPRGVVGFEPAGEDSHVSTQKVAAGDDLLKADEQAGKPEDGDPLAPDSAEAERRLDAPADGDAVAKTATAEGVEGGAGVAPSSAPSTEQGGAGVTPTAKRGSGSGGSAV